MYLLSIVIFVSILQVAVFEDSLNQTSVPKRKKRSNCECGQQPDSLLQTRIVGGTETEPHDYPWAVGIVKGTRLHCGGAIITDRHVLSAGHCFKWDDFRIMTVLLGAQFLNRRKDVQTRKISKATIHEGFTSNEIRDINDIAIAELDKAVKFNNFVSSVCLPDPMQEFDKKVATIVGWGKLGVNKDSSNTLREVKVTVLTEAECLKTSLPTEYLTNSMMCAYAEGKDGCQGDSGGPLLVYDHSRGGRFVSAGIVSWGLGCAMPNKPGVYTKVSYYIDWIQGKTKNGKYCQ